MYVFRLFAVLFVASLLSACADGQFFSRRDAADEVAVAPATPNTEDYRLGVGDVITIRVYDWRGGATGGAEDDLRIEKIRLDRGTISLPFGDFTAVGHTLKELEAAMVQSLRGRLLRNPRVWTNIEEYRPFYIEGQVGRPGSYPYQPGLTVRKAVAIGGGLRERASLKKMYVVREGDASNVRVRVNLNSPVGPGDTVTVEETFF